VRLPYRSFNLHFLKPFCSTLIHSVSSLPYAENTFVLGNRQAKQPRDNPDLQLSLLFNDLVVRFIIGSTKMVSLTNKYYLGLSEVSLIRGKG